MFLIVIKCTIHKKIIMGLKIYSVKNRSLRVCFTKNTISIFLPKSFFMIICVLKTKGNFSRDKNTFRSSGLLFKLLKSLFLCFQIKSASDSEAQKAKTARGVKKSVKTGVCCQVDSPSLGGWRFPAHSAFSVFKVA